MKHTYYSLVAVALFATVPVALAEHSHASTGHGHAGRGPAPAVSKQDSFDIHDANKDGWLSKAELAKHPMAAHASMVDADKDGRLSRSEFKALQDM